MGFKVLTAAGAIKQGSAPTNDLTLATGTLPVNHGGTGVATLTGIPLGTGTAALSAIASPSDATKFLNGAATPAFAQVKDADLATTDVTTNDVTNAKHGFAPKNPGDATKFLNGNGAYTVPTVAQWTLIASQVAAGATQYDFTGLSGYSEVRIVLSAITLSSSGEVQCRVSTDNGLNFLSSSGDYQAILGTGANSATTLLRFYSGSATIARYGDIWIAGLNLAAPKPVRSNFFSTDGIGFQLITTTTAINAVRVLAGAGNLSGGTIYVLGR